VPFFSSLLGVYIDTRLEDAYDASCLLTVAPPNNSITDPSVSP